MKRQYDYTVGPGVNAAPGGGGVCGKNWTNKHIFERWGDDNSVYFQDPTQKLMMNDLAPFNFSDPYYPTESNNFPRTPAADTTVLLKVAPGQNVSTFLCEESHNVKRNLCLGSGASSKVYLDAWEQWQTVPISVQVSSKSKNTIFYDWIFYNYLPINGTPTDGSGQLTAGCPPISLSPPIILTLGHTNRSPLGEFPVSEATKNKKCYCASERPYIVFTNTTSHSKEKASTTTRSNDELLISIKIAK